MKLAREETKIKVTGRSFYRKNNLKFKSGNQNWNRNWSRNRNWNRNRGKKIWDPEPEPERRQNGMVLQHCFQLCQALRQLLDFQMTEKLFFSCSCWAATTPELMAVMLEVCPLGVEKTNVFAYLFYIGCPGRSELC
jgi:hypothetical protein